MAVIVVPDRKLVRMCFPLQAMVRSRIADETILQGQALAQIAASGRVWLADANVTARQQFRGIALNKAYKGQPVDVLMHGEVYGYDLSARSYDDLIYLSDTVGEMEEVVSATKTVNIGRVMAISDSDATKVLLVVADHLRNW